VLDGLICIYVNDWKTQQDRFH